MIFLVYCGEIDWGGKEKGGETVLYCFCRIRIQTIRIKMELYIVKNFIFYFIFWKEYEMILVVMSFDVGFISIAIGKFFS